MTFNYYDSHREAYTALDKLSDKMAEFGGSWSFLTAFFASMLVWIGYNVYTYAFVPKDTFDPYPFILLNLVLSCLAAVQAPIIMMSQNRQEARDRHRAAAHFAATRAVLAETQRLEKRLEEAGVLPRSDPMSAATDDAG